MKIFMKYKFLLWICCNVMIATYSKCSCSAPMLILKVNYKLQIKSLLNVHIVGKYNIHLQSHISLLWVRPYFILLHLKLCHGWCPCWLKCLHLCSHIFIPAIAFELCLLTVGFKNIEDVLRLSVIVVINAHESYL